MLRRSQILCLSLAAAVLMTGSLHAQTGPALRKFADTNNFYVGASLNSWDLDDVEAVLAREFNMVVPENDLKMCFVQPYEGVFEFDGADRLVSFAEANQMTVRGHTLVWHECFPDWLAEKDLTREEAIDAMQEHISTVASRYAGRIAYWDVVNEALADDGTLRQTHWQRWVGDDYIALAFQFAHEAAPDAQLFYNDYSVESINAKSDAMYALVSGLQQDGVPIHGVGLQTHLDVGDLRVGGRIEPDDFRRNIQRFGQLGLTVQITEADLAHYGPPTPSVMRQQAKEYYRMTEICLQASACNGLIVWGVHDGLSWLRLPQFFDNPQTSPLLFDERQVPKPAYDAVRDALAVSAGGAPITGYGP